MDYVFFGVFFKTFSVVVDMPNFAIDGYVFLEVFLRMYFQVFLEFKFFWRMFQKLNTITHHHNLPLPPPLTHHHYLPLPPPLTPSFLLLSPPFPPLASFLLWSRSIGGREGIGEAGQEKRGRRRKEGRGGKEREEEKRSEERGREMEARGSWWCW